MKISKYAKLHNVTIRTVWNWIRDGKLNITRSNTNRVSIVIDVIKELNVGIYCRVSSSENKDNLERQKNRLIDYCNAKGYRVSKVVCEIGSGLNDERPKLESLLLDKTINLIVVEHKDRLTRFGLNYITKLLELDQRKIEIVNVQETNEKDLMEDFVSIITSFCSRLYGRRRNKRKTEELIVSLKNI